MPPRSELPLPTTAPPADAYAALDGALAAMATAGPDLANGLSNHAPMAVEALCALGRGDAVPAWLAGYREGFRPWPERRAELTAGAHEEALGRRERAADWRELFARELATEAWPRVIERWLARLAPAACADATHGLIRVGHAVRALGVAESPMRREELASALACWAAGFQRLPTAPSHTPALPPRDAIRRVPLVPAAQRRFRGTIVDSLASLAEFAPFAPVISLARVEGDPEERVSELTETFARVLLGNARDLLGTVVFVHGVTSAAAVRPLLPHLREETVRSLLRHVWQAGCALYAAFGSVEVAEADAPGASVEPVALARAAVGCGDEHAIKLGEACLREHAHRPSPVYLACARHALVLLGGADRPA